MVEERVSKQKRITLKTVHDMMDGMSVELAEKVHLLFMVNYIDHSGGTPSADEVPFRVLNEDSAT